ncbi:MAG: methyltransferase domain-containing protein [Nitrospirae bacterium]|nr:MAG: methyltransferase domain-containing protein [Nitrospirota bacterium]
MTGGAPGSVRPSRAIPFSSTCMILMKRLRIYGKLALKSWMPGQGLSLKRAAWIWLSESGTTSLDSSPSGRRLDGVSGADRPVQTGTNDSREHPDLAVVIPAWNERENIELLLPALKEMIADLGLTAEIVVADADLSHRPVFLEEFWRRRDEAEVLIASRYVPGGRADMSRFRRLLSHILNRTYSRVLSFPLRDLSSGFRMYHRDVLLGLTLVARDFDVLEEILIRVHAEGWRILEIPFHYMSRGSGRSHVRLFKFGWAFTKTLVRMWKLRNSVAAADYDHRAFDSPIWLQRYWQRTRHRIVLGFLEDRKSVLDIGCGSSRIIQDLPDAVGLDILQHKLRWLKPRHRLLVRASCNRLPFRTGSFAAVINSEVIEHVPDCHDIWSEMWRVLRPGGILVVGTPDYNRWLWWVLEWIYGKVLFGAYAHEHITHFTREEVARRLRAIGYEILDCRYVGFCEMIFKAKKPPPAATR